MDWIDAIPADRRNAFLAKLRSTASTDSTVRLNLEQGWLTREGQADVRLKPIADTCADAPESTWTRIMQAFLEQTQGLNWESAKDRLRVRLVSTDLAPAGLIGVELCSDLIAHVVVEVGDLIITVTREDIDMWRIDDKQVFSGALAQTLRREVIEANPIELAGFPMTLIEGESYYAASHVLAIARYIDETPQGTLVAVPNRHVAFVCPIAEPGHLQAIAPLAKVAADAFRDGPGSISDRVFWLREGRWSTVAFEKQDDGLLVIGPGGLVSLIEGWGK